MWTEMEPRRWWWGPPQPNGGKALIEENLARERKKEEGKGVWWVRKYEKVERKGVLRTQGAAEEKASRRVSWLWYHVEKHGRAEKKENWEEKLEIAYWWKWKLESNLSTI